MEKSDNNKESCGEIFFEQEDKIINDPSFISPSNESSSISRGSNKRKMSSSEKINFSSIYCRICHEDESSEELVDPCKCTGSLGLVHASCLEKWLSTSNTDRCEICKYIFTVQRKNKPIAQWWKSSSVNGPRGIAGDAICLLILTPLCIAATYLCALGASAYTRLGYWEGTGLAILCTLLLASYCLWLAVTLRFHCKIWRRWRRYNQDVVLLEKHKTEATRILNEKASTSDQSNRNIQDSNNNNNINNINAYDSRINRFIFNISFTHQEDPAYAMRYQTSYV